MRMEITQQGRNRVESDEFLEEARECCRICANPEEAKHLTITHIGFTLANVTPEQVTHDQLGEFLMEHMDEIVPIVDQTLARLMAGGAVLQ